jgi:hypothetical protein
LSSRISAPLLVAIALSGAGIGGMDPAQGQGSFALLLWLPRPAA